MDIKGKALRYLQKAFNLSFEMNPFLEAKSNKRNLCGVHMDIKGQALRYLQKAFNDTTVTFRSGQWESIESLLQTQRTLVVQRTGWGKSMVYFLATKLLRQQSQQRNGPTLLISPLLSLMRNQLDAAERIGITARTINSTNSEEWQNIKQELAHNNIDLLLISPERLANEDFVQNVLSGLTKKVSLFVIDEAHCISDWGHDFRPDYRRIVRVLQAFPANVPVLATTATANNRVVADIQKQLGAELSIQRGTLVRKSLQLQNIIMPNPAARMAWLAQTIPLLPSSGIVYTLTQRDANRVAYWLQLNGILAKAYHAELDSITREDLEKNLLANEVKVLVATVALGMGFDKPDLGFVIHFQRPSSVVHYYQQVGRAGRAVDTAYGVLLSGAEDDRIANYFIQQAFPPQMHIASILHELNEAENGLSIPEIQKKLNLRQGQIEKTLKFLSIDSPSPITKIETKWHATALAQNYTVNQEYIDAITAIRHREQEQMQKYMTEKHCLMEFLQKALDDPTTSPCGKCASCSPENALNETVSQELTNRAAFFLRRAYQPLYPRKKWPAKNMFSQYTFSGVNIPKEQQAEEGRILSLWRDAGWGKKVADGKYIHNTFDDELVTACVNMLQEWNLDLPPQWVACVPSLNRPHLVPDFAQKLAHALKLPFVACIAKVRPNREQKDMDNSYHQAKNLDGVFSVDEVCMVNVKGPCLLVDDIVNSGWTFTVVSALLRQAGCTAVYPMGLALNSPKMD